MILMHIFFGHCKSCARTGNQVFWNLKVNWNSWWDCSLLRWTDNIREMFVLCYQSTAPFLSPSFWVPFAASHSPLMHSSHTKYVCITAASLYQTRLAIFFHISFFQFSYFIWHVLSFPCFISQMMDLLWTLFQLLQHLL